MTGVQIGNFRALKLGALSGLAWGLILAGCKINVVSNQRAIGLAAAIFLMVIFLIVSSPFWVPDLFPERYIDKAGGGTPSDDEDEGSEDP